MFLSPHLSQSDCCTNPNKTSTSSSRLTQQSIERNQTITRRLSQEQLQPRLYLSPVITTETTDPTRRTPDQQRLRLHSTIHQGYLRNHRTNPTTTRYPRYSQTDNNLMTATNQREGQSRTKGQTGSGIQDQMLRLSATYVGMTGRNLNTRLTEHRRVTKNSDNKNNIAEHHLQTDHRIDWDSAECISFSTDYYQRLTLESWFTNLERTPLNRCQQLPAPYKRLLSDKQNKSDKQRNQTHDDQSVFTANSNTT